MALCSASISRIPGSGGSTSGLAIVGLVLRGRIIGIGQVVETAQLLDAEQSIAVDHDDDAVRQVCESSGQGQVVSAVNFNSPGQVVIAGDKAAVERACEAAKEAGAKRALVLPVSVPSHCSLMEPAAEALSERLASIDIAEPSIPVVHNVNVQSLTDGDAIREALASQLYSPVRWVETIQSVAGSGVTQLIEMGPGKVLAGLTKRIDRSLESVCVQDPGSLEKALSWCEGE